MMPAPRPIGDLIRDWRQRRRLSQMALALEADVSTRHVSYLESGRAKPSREMLLRLAEPLAIPLRDRNHLLVAAGYAPVYPERALDTDALRLARTAIERVLKGHEPYPALAVDRHWTMLEVNEAVAPLLIGVSKALLRPPINVLRLSLHPNGLAPRILNLAEWRDHLLTRLRHQIEVSGDPELQALLDEMSGYPFGDDSAGLHPPTKLGDILVPLRLQVGDDDLSLFSTTTVFGTPVDITLSEVAIESFFPADDATSAILNRAR